MTSTGRQRPAPRDRARAPFGLLVLAAALVALLFLLPAAPVGAAPGLCVGPVCGDQFSRSGAYPWQLRLRLQDQGGHRERLVVDCRDGSISPLVGPIERGYAAAVGRRACRMAPLSAPREPVAPGHGGAQPHLPPSPPSPPAAGPSSAMAGTGPLAFTPVSRQGGGVGAMV